MTSTGCEVLASKDYLVLLHGRLLRLALINSHVSVHDCKESYRTFTIPYSCIDWKDNCKLAQAERSRTKAFIPMPHSFAYCF